VGAQACVTLALGRVCVTIGVHACWPMKIGQHKGRPAFACANTPGRNTKTWGAVTLARVPMGLPMQPRNIRDVKLVLSKRGGVCRGVPGGVLGRARLR